MALSIKSLTGLRFSCHDLFSCFSLKTNYHYTLQYPKIYQPGLHALKNMLLDQVSGSYNVPGSIRNHFPVWAKKQTTLIDLKINQPFTHWKNMPLDQVSAYYMAPGSISPCFSLWAKIRNYPDRRRQKINLPGLHALKKYASAPSFSLLHGYWL